MNQTLNELVDMPTMMNSYRDFIATMDEQAVKDFRVRVQTEISNHPRTVDLERWFVARLGK